MFQSSHFSGKSKHEKATLPRSSETPWALYHMSHSSAADEKILPHRSITRCPSGFWHNDCGGLRLQMLATHKTRVVALFMWPRASLPCGFWKRLNVHLFFFDSNRCWLDTNCSSILMISPVSVQPKLFFSPFFLCFFPTIAHLSVEFHLKYLCLSCPPGVLGPRSHTSNKSSEKKNWNDFSKCIDMVLRIEKTKRSLIPCLHGQAFLC